MREIFNAEDIDRAQVAIKAFEIDYGAKYPKAVAKIVDDAEPQPPDLGRGHERRPQQALLGQLRQPHRIQLVFGRPGTFLTSRALTSCTASPAASSR